MGFPLLFLRRYQIYQKSCYGRPFDLIPSRHTVELLGIPDISPGSVIHLPAASFLKGSQLKAQRHNQEFDQCSQYETLHLSSSTFYPLKSASLSIL